MNERTAKSIDERFKHFERIAVRRRIGVVTDDDPLSVALGGSDVPYTDVATLTPFAPAIDDVVVVELAGNNALVTGCLNRAGAPVVTALPNNPRDGQECFLVADASSGVVWHLRYRAASASSYKWEFVGGPPLRSVVDTEQNTGSGTYGDLGTVGPSITLPSLAGDYDLEWGAGIYNNTAARYGNIDISIAGAAQGVLVEHLEPTGGNTNLEYVTRQRRFTGVSSGAVVKLIYAVSGGGSAFFRNRWLKITPVRLG